MIILDIQITKQADKDEALAIFTAFFLMVSLLVIHFIYPFSDELLKTYPRF